MKISTVACAILFCCVPAFAEFAVGYGEGEGKLAFYNSRNHPNAEELYPVGPLSFRIVENEIWVADSLAGRILRFSQDGKPNGTIKVAFDPNGRIEDFAVKTSGAGKVSVMVLCSAEQEIYEVAVDGKVLRKLGGVGEELGRFLQFEKIEVLPSGEFGVSDRKKQTLTLFAADGKAIREVHWDWSGFCFDPQGNFCRLSWNEDEQVNHLVIETLRGGKVKDVPLQVGPHINPDLMSVNSLGEALLTYMPQEGFQGKLKIALCDAKGQPKSVGEFAPPYVMNRYLVQNSKSDIFLGVANFDEAPGGAFKIQGFQFK